MAKSKKVEKLKSLSKRKVSHAGARAKGLQFERDVANSIGHIFPEAKRNLEYQADEAQFGHDINGTWPLRIQCKNHQNYVSISTIGEIVLSDEREIPVLITKGNRLEPMAVLPFNKLVTLLEMAAGLRSKLGTYPKHPLLTPGALSISESTAIIPEATLIVPDTQDRSNLLEDLI